MKNTFSKLSILTWITFIFLVIILIQFQYIWSHNTNMLDQDKSDTVTVNIQEKCPYYKPDGFTYRECLNDLLIGKNKLIQDEYDSLIKDIQIMIDKEAQEYGEDAYNAPRGAFLLNLNTYNQEWNNYTKIACELDTTINWGGSDRSGIYTICEIEQTHIYLNKLKELREEWIN